MRSITSVGGVARRPEVRRAFAITGIVAACAAAGCRRERDPLGNPIDGSHRVTVFAVLDDRAQILWKMSAPAPGVRSAENVEYGRVPEGFRQEVPAEGSSPRPMIAGERLVVVIVTPEHVYRGECRGDRPTEPRCESWESARPEPDVVEQALRGERIRRS